jgi:hypothetical protein
MFSNSERVAILVLIANVKEEIDEILAKEDQNGVIPGIASSLITDLKLASDKLKAADPSP